MQAATEPLIYKRGQHLRGVDAENADRVQAEMVRCLSPFIYCTNAKTCMAILLLSMHCYPFFIDLIIDGMSGCKVCKQPKSKGKETCFTCYTCLAVAPVCTCMHLFMHVVPHHVECTCICKGLVVRYSVGFVL